MIIPAHRVSLSNGLRMLSAAVTQPVVGFSIGLLGLIWAGAWVQIATEYKATLRDSMKETANIAIVFEQNVTRSVGEVDRLMLYLREAHARSGWATDWTSLLNGRYTADNQTLQISVANADGIVIASSLSGAALAKVDISDREHFAVHKRSSIDQLFVSKPLVGRASMKWSVQLTRRFLASDGRLGGVIVVTLDPSHFSRVYGEIELGTGSGLALVGTDDIIRAGTGMFQDEMGKGLKEAALTGRPLPAHNGTTIILDERDGHARVVGSRGVPGYPLFVVVGGGDITADPSLLKNRHNYMIGGGGLSLVVVLSMLAALQGRRRHEKEITYLARHDGLTNLANRALFREALDQVFCNAGEDRRVALHLLDLDRFKFVNDSYGHPVGDKLLIAVAERLRLNIRQSDLIARLGGDEFAVLQDNLTSYDYEEPRTLAERLCRVLSEPYEIDGICIEIGASIGIGMAPRMRVMPGSWFRRRTWRSTRRRAKAETAIASSMRR